ncbi:MAG: hypothetical protein HXX81_06555, partial [Campylobacterales bacterium]|nr:hypothetical protein [Campylobacterales bacterium]
MMNLSSLSKIHYANYAHIVVVMIGMVVLELTQGFNIISVGFSVCNLAIAFFAFYHIKITKGSIENTSSILKVVNDGNFEARVVKIQGGKELEELAINLNNILDQLETFIREINASVKFASENRFFRKINRQGLNKGFVNSANMIDKSICAMKVEYEKKACESFLSELGKTGKSLIDNFKIIQEQLTVTTK